MFQVLGIVAIVVFYVLILVVGLWAAKRSKKTEGMSESEDVMLAGRNIGLIVGIFTMTGKSSLFLNYSLLAAVLTTSISSIVSTATLESVACEGLD
ncbi:unnamed protein product [Protopolystoma xenopodis]|uniref:Uncharacterized protein n=1 Tax=Protopolystoma xenopodis TaxID=117903 RepID=A0A3S5AVF1_9PLAT|nr:unnamed protein product [Protopolystoma xenopodis]